MTAPVDPTHAIRSEVTNILGSSPTPSLLPFALPNGEGMVYAIRDGYKTETKPGPRREQRLHQFADIASFAAWLNRHATGDDAEILVDDDSITAALDATTHNADRVTCILVFDPAFDRWHDVFGCALSQKELHGLVRAGAGALDESTCAQLLAAVRNLTITRGSKRDMRLTELGSYQYTAKSENRDFTGTIPASFVINCPVYEGVHTVGASGTMTPASYAIEVLLTVDDTEEGDVTFTLEAPGLDAIVRQARRDAAEYLRSLLDDSFLVGMGVLKTQTVAVVNLAINADQPAE